MPCKVKSRRAFSPYQRDNNDDFHMSKERERCDHHIVSACIFICGHENAREKGRPREFQTCVRVYSFHCVRESPECVFVWVCECI